MKKSVSNPIRRFQALLMCAVLSAVILTPLSVRAESVSLAWDANTEADLAGYRIHYGTASRSYTASMDVGRVTTCSISNLAVGQTYYFAATAYNASGTASDYSSEVSYSIPAPNGAPSTPATPAGASSGWVNTAYTFTTSATDPNGHSLEYRYDWGNGSISGWGAAVRTNTWPSTGQFNVKAQARDSLGALSGWSAARAITIGQNRQPVSNAGPDQAVTSGASVTLNGAGSSDPDDGIAGYQWRQVGGTSVQLAGSQSQSASFVSPTLSSGSASLVFELRVTDHLGLSSTDTCTVTVAARVADSDGDGVPDSQDAFPNDPSRWQVEQSPVSPSPATPGPADGNRPPLAPELVAPMDDEVVGLTPVLRTGAFADPDGDRHAATRWQVFRDDDSLCVLDVQSDVALTSLSVAKLVLEEETAYFWRVQFIDAAGTASPWSDYEYFSTAALGIDRNSNGVPDAQEVNLNTDLDRNGVKDYKQSDLRAIVVEGKKAKIALSIAGSPTAIAIEALESEDPNQTNPESSGTFAKLPFGLINFRIAVQNPGEQAAVKIFFSKAAPRGSVWYKYDAKTGVWMDFSECSTFAPDRRSITLVLRDGGPGDADGIANGVIVDPSGVGVPKKEKRKNRNK